MPTTTASAAWSVERLSRDPESLVQFPAGGFGVALFATGPGWVLKCTYIFLKCTQIYSNLSYIKNLLKTVFFVGKVFLLDLD